MFFRSERLFLRPGWPEDWQDLFALIDDEGIARNLSRTPWPYTPEHAQAFAGRMQETGLPHFFVTLPSASGAKLIGCAGLARHDMDVELGFWIAREFWGRGFATEAARAVLNVARALGHPRIVSAHFLDNPASGHVLRKVGFRPTGEERRFCPARGTEASCRRYAIDLGGSEGGNDDDAADVAMRPGNLAA